MSKVHQKISVCSRSI